MRAVPDIGVAMASYQRSSGTRWKNSARCEVALARALRIASNTSGTRSPSETDSPGRSAGAIAAARALSATTSPRWSRATTGSGSADSTAWINGSATPGALGSSFVKDAGAASVFTLAIRAAAAIAAKPASAGAAAIVPSIHKALNATAAATSTRRVRLSATSHRAGRKLALS